MSLLMMFFVLGMSERFDRSAKTMADAMITSAIMLVANPASFRPTLSRIAPNVGC
jgi:hypothetical protein